MRLVWGSLSLVRSVAEAGLVDEYQLWLLPVVLGGGTQLFPDGLAIGALELLEARTSDRGSVLLRYRPR